MPLAHLGFVSGLLPQLSFGEHQALVVMPQFGRDYEHLFGIVLGPSLPGTVRPVRQLNVISYA